VRVLVTVESRMSVHSEEKREMEWYGKPGKKPVTITGDPIVCYIVGGTCYAEVGM
jgi:hypothetical protein